MKLSPSLIVILSAVALVSCEVFFEEKFLDGELNVRDDSLCCCLIAVNH